METKVEGILISKTPYREKDLIGQLLLRNGGKISVVFHGGRSSRKGKSSILELGYLIGMELKRPKHKSNSPIYVASEWELRWSHQKIRSSYEAFAFFCFILEIISKVAQGEDLDHSHDAHSGIFRVASNALFFLENSLQKECFDMKALFCIFLSKLLFELGVSPELKGCLFCEKDLSEEVNVVLVPEQGGFLCSDCFPGDAGNSGKEMHQLLCMLWNLKYSEYEQVSITHSSTPLRLFNYFAYQIGLEEKDFKSAKMLFSLI